MQSPHPWWNQAVIYQVYPRSFQDSNGDGIGDLPGILHRLDYLKNLGVDALWISPIFPSPMRDAGYDISDYRGIDPVFGTLADFDRLLAAAHRLGLKVLLDLVPNHTSDLHPWFIDARRSRTSPYRDWYVWKDAAPGGGPPNNWLSIFGGSAWEWEPTTEQYYYHAFLMEQPDLNWRHPEVADAIFQVIRFWLDKGVDGFRVDAPENLVEDAWWRDNPANPDYRASDPTYRQQLPVYTRDLTETHEVMHQMRQVFDAYPERVFIAETNTDTAGLVSYYGKDRLEAHLPFNFQLIFRAWNAREIGALVDEYETALPPGGWPNWVLGNHDRARLASRIGEAQARVAALLLLTLRGTPTIYNGEELGMADVPIPPERMQDPYETRDPGKGLSRDPQRTPMQWEPGAGAGFTTGEPWLPLAADRAQRNVAVQSDDPHSLLNLYRRLLRLRRDTPALRVGDYAPVKTEVDVLGYTRDAGSEHFLVLLNFSEHPRHFHSATLRGKLVISTGPGREGEAVAGEVALRPNEGLLVRLETAGKWVCQAGSPALA